MIRHVVQMKWKPDTTDAQVQAVRDGLATMPDLVPGILRYEFGSDLGMTEGANDFVLVADFADEDDYRAYAAHPDHVAMIGAAIAPIVEAAYRVQYEI